jgi:hypothetical protein
MHFKNDWLIVIFKTASFISLRIVLHWLLASNLLRKGFQLTFEGHMTYYFMNKCTTLRQHIQLDLFLRTFHFNIIRFIFIIIFWRDTLYIKDINPFLVPVYNQYKSYSFRLLYAMFIVSSFKEGHRVSLISCLWWAILGL